MSTTTEFHPDASGQYVTRFWEVDDCCGFEVMADHSQVNIYFADRTAAIRFADDLRAAIHTATAPKNQLPTMEEMRQEVRDGCNCGAHESDCPVHGDTRSPETKAAIAKYLDD